MPSFSRQPLFLRFRANPSSACIFSCLALPCRVKALPSWCPLFASPFFVSPCLFFFASPRFFFCGLQLSPSPFLGLAKRKPRERQGRPATTRRRPPFLACCADSPRRRTRAIRATSKERGAKAKQRKDARLSRLSPTRQGKKGSGGSRLAPSWGGRRSNKARQENGTARKRGGGVLRSESRGKARCGWRVESCDLLDGLRELKVATSQHEECGAK